MPHPASDRWWRRSPGVRRMRAQRPSRASTRWSKRLTRRIALHLDGVRGGQLNGPDTDWICGLMTIVGQPLQFAVSRLIRENQVLCVTVRLRARRKALQMTDMGRLLTGSLRRR